VDPRRYKAPLLLFDISRERSDERPPSAMTSAHLVRLAFLHVHVVLLGACLGDIDGVMVLHSER
jgi:hypothetical protein